MSISALFQKKNIKEVQRKKKKETLRQSAVTLNYLCILKKEFTAEFFMYSIQIYFMVNVGISNTKNHVEMLGLKVKTKYSNAIILDSLLKNCLSSMPLR